MIYDISTVWYDTNAVIVYGFIFALEPQQELGKPEGATMRRPAECLWLVATDNLFLAGS